MKKFTLLSAVIFTVNMLFAQWHFHNPLPQGNTLWDVHFFDSNMGLAVGDGGTVLRTSDGGLSWDLVDVNVTADLYAVTFINADLGFACGSNGTVLRTVDGGETWEPLLSDVPQSLRDIHAGCYPRIMAAGDNGTVVLSEDGGLSWHTLPIGTGAALHSVLCVNALESWAVGEEGTILHSANGGNRWDAIETGTSVSLHKIVFTNDTTGWITGDQGVILKTLNGGEKWDAQPSGVKANLNSMCFCDVNRGWIVGQDGTVLFTSDGGMQWQVQQTDAALELLSVFSCNTQRCYAVGECGALLKTTNGGTSWQTLSSGFYGGALRFGSFTDDSHGWSCGWNGDIYHSADAGTTWTSQGTLPDFIGSGSDIGFTDPDQGWFVHSSNWNSKNAVLYTSDKGKTWDTSYFSPNYMETFCKISFVSPDTGWIGGMTIVEDPWYGWLMKYVVLRTYKGGNTWNRKTFSKSNMLIFYSELNDMFFLDKSHGWAIGYSEGMNESTGEFYWTKEVLRTINGGTSWQVIPVDNIPKFMWQSKIYFVTKDVGWIYDQGGSTLFKTTDGGIHWGQIGYTGPGINDIYFTDPDNGLAACGGPDIMGTSDGGITWIPEKSPTAYYLYRIFFTETGDGWAYGDGSTILHLADTTTVGTKEIPLLQESCINVYPNPFTNSITIEYKLSQSQDVTIQINNYLGQLIDILVNEEQMSGEHIVHFHGSDLPAGIYFVSLQSGDTSVTRKMTLMR